MEEIAAAIAAAAALPFVNLLIAQERHSHNYFKIISHLAFVEDQTRETELQLLRS